MEMHMSIRDILASVGLERVQQVAYGTLYGDRKGDLAVIHDWGICEAHKLPYVDYTTEQNEHMYRYGRLLRFLVENEQEENELRDQLSLLTKDDWDIPDVIRPGPDRSENSLDPSGPEAWFEEVFVEAFGTEALPALNREVPFIDLTGHVRYIDYVLQMHDGQIAIELNGESFHHPAVIGKVRYKSQLLKQNCLAAAGIKVYRWSLRGMQDRERFIAELHRFMGDAAGFRSSGTVLGMRTVEQVDLRLANVSLHDYQSAALDSLAAQRNIGKNAVLLVLPPGTGKTEVAIADFLGQKNVKPDMNGLFLVPTSPLRAQALERLRSRAPSLDHRNSYVGRSLHAGMMVQTYQYMGFHFSEFASDAFDYVVIDEAHHVMAPGLNRFVRHFVPQMMVGLTATPERLDQKRVEEVFGTYETGLTLEDAILQNIIPPIKAFRVKTNVDLSKVRFRGIDYTIGDLQHQVVIPSRNKLVADVLQHYFGDDGLKKPGIVYCVSIEHAKAMAALLRKSGLSAEAVSGRDRNAADAAIGRYKEGTIQFLCSCSLLSEGFDAPATSVVVMARPTLSKALYVQQLGRGTRKHPGKEALYVIDVVDQYGPLNAPWSVHGLFGISRYEPWAEVVSTPGHMAEEEITLVQLLEYPRRIEEIDIFTFERKYGDYLSDEQMARELWISTDTLRAWVRKGEVTPDLAVPFGKKNLFYFAPPQVEEIRLAKGMNVHDESTQYKDFFDFLEERNYSQSYKMVLLLTFFALVDRQGGVDIDELARLFQSFYIHRTERGLPADRGPSLVTNPEKLAAIEAVTECILVNPFEKFERKRFLVHAKDLSRIEFPLSLWARLKDDPAAIRRVREQMARDLVEYYKNIGEIESAEEVLERFELSSRLTERPQKKWKPRMVPRSPETDFITSVPLYEFRAAAGGLSPWQDATESHWVDLSVLAHSRRLSTGMFVLQVAGRSMEPLITDGSWCLFGPPPHQDDGRVVLVQLHDSRDPEHGGHYTVKRYKGGRTISSHSLEIEPGEIAVELHPENGEFDPLRIKVDEVAEMKIVGEFLEVLDPSIT